MAVKVGVGITAMAEKALLVVMAVLVLTDFWLYYGKGEIK